jgi:hypothetical protein
VTSPESSGYLILAGVRIAVNSHINCEADVGFGSVAEIEAAYRVGPLSARSGPITPVGLAPSNGGNSDPLPKANRSEGHRSGHLLTHINAKSAA